MNTKASTPFGEFVFLLIYKSKTVYMETLYVVMESYHADYEHHGSHPIGVYSSEELALNAIERARLILSNEMTFEEFLEEGNFDPDYDYDRIVESYSNYQYEIADRSDCYSWHIEEFKLDGAE